MINKLLEAIPEESWVSVTEMPNGCLQLEGYTDHPEYYKSYQVAKIMFSKEAIKVLIPLLKEWVKK